MNNLCAEIGYKSINHEGEQLCGDHVDVVEQGEDSTVIVLADGLGSGVKASILSTLTSKIISTMMAAGLSLEECVSTIAATLPICSVRGVAYSTFTIIHLLHNTQAELIQYDNPHVILLRDNQNFDYPKTELNIGVLVWKYSDTYGSSVRVAMDKYAKEIGAEKGLTINLEMQDGNDDQATQNNQADVMFAAGKDHIIINLCDTSAGQYLVDLAKQYNVPISFYNKEPVDSTIVTGSNSIFVGTKPEEAGIMQGEILADLYAANPERVDKNGDGKVATLEFEGEINNPEAIARTEYSLSTAIEKGVPCEMMTENQVANWDTAKAQEMMTAQIASLGVENIEVVFCNNDDMAIGVIAALNEVGYTLGDGGDEGIVIGVDCTDTAVEYINAGKLYGTVKQDGDAMGKANILMAINGALGKDWLDGTDYTMADDGYSIRIPYAKVTAE